MITEFNVDEDGKTILWKSEGKQHQLQYVYPVLANHAVLLNEVIVQADVREFGEQNLFLYRADGSVKARPAMPKLKHKVTGVYAVWFVPDEIKLTAVLISNEYKPYGTACIFDLKTHRFSRFRPTN
jgi:hypothetical protein